jgi:integrase
VAERAAPWPGSSPWDAVIVRIKEEVAAVTAKAPYPYGLVIGLLYGCGLRLFECLNLHVQCFNFDDGVLTVHDGMGKKARRCHYLLAG